MPPLLSYLFNTQSLENRKKETFLPDLPAKLLFFLSSSLCLTKRILLSMQLSSKAAETAFLTDRNQNPLGRQRKMKVWKHSYMNHVHAIFHFRIWAADNYHQVLELVILPVIIVYKLHLQAPKLQTKKMIYVFFFPPKILISLWSQNSCLIPKHHTYVPNWTGTGEALPQFPERERERQFIIFYYINYYILTII